jgi:hypothetical protein
MIEVAGYRLHVTGCRFQVVIDIYIMEDIRR